MVNYLSVQDQLVNRIIKLIPSHPEILVMKEYQDLFDIEEFNCSDLAPKLTDVQWALSKAKILHI